jgi:hypothetical protein
MMYWNQRLAFLGRCLGAATLSHVTTVSSCSNPFAHSLPPSESSSAVEAIPPPEVLTLRQQFARGQMQTAAANIELLDRLLWGLSPEGANEK